MVDTWARLRVARGLKAAYVAGSPRIWGLLSARMASPDRIVVDPAIHHGKPVIRGTRVPVTTVVGSLAGGMTFEEVQREYDLTAEDIRSALKFVAELADQESFHPLPARASDPRPVHAARSFAYATEL